MKKTYVTPAFEAVVLEPMCKQLINTSVIPVVDDNDVEVKDPIYEDGPGILSKPFQGAIWE